METFAELPYIQMERLATGKLGIHEEWPDAVAGAIMTFLRG
jgi:hypothetical protein